MKKTIALLLALIMVLGMLAGCTNDPDPTETPTTTGGNNNDDQLVIEEFNGDYVYKDSVVTLATNWNPHTYQTNDDSYPAEFLRVGLYGFIFNDALHPVEGKEDFAGYKIIPEMAASEPVDVTEKVAAEHPEFNIPEGMTKGYAYTIDLNQNACWEDGTPIKAADYVYSMKQLLDPDLYNYRASDYFDGDFSIAGAKEYNYQKTTAYTGAYDENGDPTFGLEDLTKGEDGIYRNADGDPIGIAVDFAIDWLGGDALSDYVNDERYINAGYLSNEKWDELVAACDRRGVAPLTDENLALVNSVLLDGALGTADCYFVVGKYYEEVNYDDVVGCYASGEYQITIVLTKSLMGFNLLYNLSSNWLVREDLYEANKKLDTATGFWTSTYNTSVASTSSYGPYKLTSYQKDKEMTFEKNENWYGYSDDLHVYQDPTDGKYYRQYMTTEINCQVVGEADTRKTMFLAGQLMGYGLQTSDFDTYRNSDKCYATPGQTIFFLVFNGNLDALAKREAADDFDTTKYDLQTMSLKSFKSAMSLVYDKELFAATISPARSGAYGVIGTAYIYDPETGARYRDTDQAKKALCTYYGVDTSKYATLDDAVASITGYDPEQAKVLFKQAFDEALEAGYITDEDNDGVSDQTIKIEYCSSATSDFMTKTLKYMNEKLAEVTVGTPFEGKVVIEESAPYGNEWSNKLKQGLSDTCLCGWTGSAMNPFSLTDLYVNPAKMFNLWFDATKVDITLTIQGEEITMNMYQWSDCLNGTAVEVNGKNYNFGDGQADVEDRLEILAAIELAILETGDYIPTLQDGSMALQSHQVYYVVEEYNPVMGRGGIQYLKYNYDEAAWTEYVAAQGGELKY